MQESLQRSSKWIIWGTKTHNLFNESPRDTKFK